jgi:hypothetical protein
MLRKPPLFMFVRVINKANSFILTSCPYYSLSPALFELYKHLFTFRKQARPIALYF